MTVIQNSGKIEKEVIYTDNVLLSAAIDWECYLEVAAQPLRAPAAAAS